MAAAEPFKPRLRLDVSSGRRSLSALEKTADSLSVSQGLGGKGSLLSPKNSTAVQGHRATAASPDFERAITLMQGRHTQDMHDRHISMLHTICKQCAGGFYVHNLGQVEILMGCAARQVLACVPPLAILVPEPRTRAFICRIGERHWAD
eukprot:3545577-Pleurochrysis_carterae.AAC.2